MSARPTISVVVPYFGSEATIAACIESLLAQEGVDRGEVELIFIDNGSPDASAAIVSRYPELITLREEQPGAYAARNAGIRRARAPIIAFTDADCVPDRDWLRSILGGMVDERTAVVVGHCRYPDEATWALRLLGSYENAKTAYVLGRCPPANHFAYANNMAVRASVFEQIGTFETWRRAGDSELVHRLALKRPDLRMVFASDMRITHLEFLSVRQRIRRLSLYTQTNARIGTFRELSVFQRLGVVGHWLVHRRVL
ncbi:MAG: glycosyltransferase family 2 protein [Acidobacteriota bacterium]